MDDNTNWKVQYNTELYFIRTDPPRKCNTIQYGKLYFKRHDPQPEAGLKHLMAPDAEMLCPTQPTLQTYITKGANLAYDNGVIIQYSTVCNSSNSQLRSIKQVKRKCFQYYLSFRAVAHLG